MLPEDEEKGLWADRGIPSRRVHLRVHFASSSKANRAANAVGRHASKVFVSRAAPVRAARRMRQEVSPPNLLQPHWLAFGGGLALGAAVLQLVFPGLLGSVRVGPATAANLVLAGFVISGLALACGWLAGALTHYLQRRPRGHRRPVGYDLQAEVAGAALRDAEQALRQTGAVVVWVLGDEPLAEPELATRAEPEPVRRPAGPG